MGLPMRGESSFLGELHVDIASTKKRSNNLLDSKAMTSKIKDDSSAWIPGEN